MDTISPAREHLNWCVERAMQYYDSGDHSNAIASFASDVRKHEGTAWIFEHPLLMPLMLAEMGKGSAAFRRCLDGWAVA